MKWVTIFPCLVALAATRREGSGDIIRDDVDEAGVEGSGEEDFDELTLVPDRDYNNQESDYDIHFDSNSKYEDLEYNEMLENYEFTEDDENDSVLQITKDTFMDVEIKPRPPTSEEEFVLETSQILIMVGSAFISFGLVMFAFFMCRKVAEKKKQKGVSSILGQISTGREQTSIVKDYRRVPTDTQEYLNTKDNTNIENMERGSNTKDPLIERK